MLVLARRRARSPARACAIRSSARSPRPSSPLLREALRPRRRRARCVIALIAAFALLRTWRRPSTECLCIAIAVVLPIVGYFARRRGLAQRHDRALRRVRRVTFFLAIRYRHHALFLAGAHRHRHRRDRARAHARPPARSEARRSAARSSSPARGSRLARAPRPHHRHRRDPVEAHAVRRRARDRRHRRSHPAQRLRQRRKSAEPATAVEFGGAGRQLRRSATGSPHRSTR